MQVSSPNLVVKRRRTAMLGKSLLRRPPAYPAERSVSNNSRPHSIDSRQLRLHLTAPTQSPDQAMVAAPPYLTRNRLLSHLSLHRSSPLPDMLCYLSRDPDASRLFWTFGCGISQPLRNQHLALQVTQGLYHIGVSNNKATKLPYDNSINNFAMCDLFVH